MANILLIFILCISSTYCVESSSFHSSQESIVVNGTYNVVMADADDEWDEEALHRIREDVEAELAAVDDFPMIPFQPPLGGGGIVGVFVPPAVPVNQQALAIQIARADAHEAAFPFAAIGRSFLCNIQKAWLKYWGNALAYRPELS